MATSDHTQSALPQEIRATRWLRRPLRAVDKGVKAHPKASPSACATRVCVAASRSACLGLRWGIDSGMFRYYQ